MLLPPCVIHSPSNLNSIRCPHIHIPGHENEQGKQQPSPPPMEAADLDGILVLARVCALLLQYAHGSNASSLLRLSHMHGAGAAVGGGGGGKQQKQASATAGTGGLRIDRVQLESAFTIADTRGVGELPPEVCFSVVLGFGWLVRVLVEEIEGRKKGHCDLPTDSSVLATRCLLLMTPHSSLIFTQNVQQELKEALDALGFTNASSNTSTSSGGNDDDKAAGRGRGTSGVEGFASATFPELALLCRWVR